MNSSMSLSQVPSIMGRLIAKDLYLYRWFMLAAVLAGFVSIPLMSLGPGDGVNTGANIGMIVFMTVVIALGIFIAMYGLLKERQDKSVLFVLSLPVSGRQYRLAKVVAALVAFLVPWAILTVGMVGLIATVDTAPDGAIPGFIAMMSFFLCNFCVLLALVLVTLSERWAIAGILVTNTSVPIFLSLFYTLPDIRAAGAADAAVWSTPVLAVIGASLALAVLALALALFLQSRKRDFL